MIKKYLNLVLCVCAVLLPHYSYGKSSVWKVSKGDNFFYIGGTVHLLNAQDHPLPAEFDYAYKQSDTLIFETDIKQGQKAQAQKKLFQSMLNDSGNTLTEQLEPQVLNSLKSYLAARNLPIDNFVQFKPWATALMLTMMEYQRMGMRPEYGVDEYFNQLAITDNKQVSWLESLDEQIAYLSSMEQVDPNMMLKYTLDDLQQLPDFTIFLKQAWRSGDIEAFTSHDAIQEMKTEFPVIYNTLLTKRNNNWMPKLLSLNDNNNIEFVLVGTMHLNDEQGLLQQLQRSGYTIAQLSL